LISFSFNLVSDQSLIGSGVASVRRNPAHSRRQLLAKAVIAAARVAS
jgi:hypothetical protein